MMEKQTHTHTSKNCLLGKHLSKAKNSVTSATGVGVGTVNAVGMSSDAVDLEGCSVIL